jgi:copper(I)-binding protein
MTMNDDVMKMHPVGLEIKPGETVTLRPSDLHVMLTDLQHSLKKGDVIEATFRFPVMAIGATGRAQKRHRQPSDLPVAERLSRGSHHRTRSPFAHFFDMLASKLV